MLFGHAEELGVVPPSEFTHLLTANLDGSGAAFAVAVAGKQLLVWRIGTAVGFSNAAKSFKYELLEEPVTCAAVSLPGMTPFRDFIAIVSPLHITVIGLLSVDNASLSSVFYYPMGSSISRDKREADILQRYCKRDIAAKEATKLLLELTKELHKEKKVLSDLAQRFLSLPDPPLSAPSSEQYPLQLEIARAAVNTSSLTFTKARLLDNHTEASLASIQDRITCAGTLTILHFVPGTQQPGSVLVIGTECCYVHVYAPGFSRIAATVQLEDVPRSIQIEGQANSAESLDEPTWRATILAGQGTIYTMRGSTLAKNVINLGMTLRFVHRINRTIFAITVGRGSSELLRLTAKGRVDFTYALPCTATNIAPVVIDVGRPFLGFVLALSSGSLVFVAETGVTSIVHVQSEMELMESRSPTLFYRGLCLSRITNTSTFGAMAPTSSAAALGASYGLVYVSAGTNKTLYCSIPPNVDLNKSFVDSSHAALQDRQFDVERLGSDCVSDKNMVPPLSEQQEVFKSFISTRAHAKTTVQATLLALAQTKSDMTTISSTETLRAVASVEIAGLHVSLIVTVCNMSTKITLAATVIVNQPDSPLKLGVGSAHIPPLPPGANVQRYFTFTIDESQIGKIIPAHDISVLLTRPAERNAEQGNEYLQEVLAHIPELRL